MRFSALSALALLFLGAVAGQGTQMTIQEALLSRVSAQDNTILPITTTPGFSAMVAITGVSYSGSGCPHRSVMPSLDATTGQIITLQFYQYAIKLDQYTLYNSVKKSCRIYFSLRSPTGYVFTLSAYGISGQYFLSDSQTLFTGRAAVWLASDPQMKAFAAIQTTGPSRSDSASGPVVPSPLPIDLSSVNPVILENPWWSICPPQNMAPAALGNSFERSAVVLDTSVTLQRLSATSLGYVSVDTLSGTFEKALLITWEYCTAVWEAEDGDANF